MASGAVFVDQEKQHRQSNHLTPRRFHEEEYKLLCYSHEGTRSMRSHHDLLSFRKARPHRGQAGVPVTPVVCENYWRLYRKGHFESGVLKSG